MTDNTATQTIAGAIILVGVIAAIVALAWHNTLTGTEAITALMTIITLGGGALAVHSGAKVGARAASSDPAPPSDGQ